MVGMVTDSTTDDVTMSAPHEALGPCRGACSPARRGYVYRGVVVGWVS